MMNEKRFVVESVKIIYDCTSRIAKVITDKEELYSYDDLYEICDLLNEQQATINELKERNVYNFAKKMQLQKEIKELKEEEKLYAKEIVRLNKNIEELNKTIEEALKFKSLGGDY